jgi:uncharacterized protein YcbK (DUF882 family)
LKPTLNELGKLAKDKHRKQKYFDKLKRRLKNLDYVMQDLHDAEFKKTDCLKCVVVKRRGLYSPLQILSGCQNILSKSQQFIEQYLRDEDQGLRIAKCAL